MSVRATLDNSMKSRIDKVNLLVTLPGSVPYFGPGPVPANAAQNPDNQVASSAPSITSSATSQQLSMAVTIGHPGSYPAWEIIYYHLTGACAVGAPPDQLYEYGQLGAIQVN